MLRTVGRTVGKVKRLAGEFQGQFQDAMREMELDEARKTVEGLNTEVSTTLNTGFNPIQTIRDEIKGATETPATGAAALPETTIDIPEPPPVPDLTPEQIQAAFAPVSPLGARRRRTSAQSRPPSRSGRARRRSRRRRRRGLRDLFPLATPRSRRGGGRDWSRRRPSPGGPAARGPSPSEAGPAEGRAPGRPRPRRPQAADAEKPTTEDEGSAG